MRKRVWMIGAFVVAFLGCYCTPGISAPIATSTFDAGSEGWGYVNDGSTPQWIASGGNPGGFLRIVDSGYGSWWYFSAPDKFLGDASDAFGASLIFDMRVSTTDDPGRDEPVVVLEGEGKTLTAALSAPGTTWTHYDISLVDGVWRLGRLTGEVATSADLQMVLGHLTALHIRGEYSDGRDIGDLDNVVLGLTPTVHTVAVSPSRTYLRTESDPASASIPVDLAALGLRSGDFVRLERLGDYSFHDPRVENGTSMLGIFSGTADILAGDRLQRLPNAIDVGIDFATVPTHVGTLSTDISEDFLIENTLVRIPDGARYLFVSANDEFFSDNLDTDSDFAVQITLIGNAPAWALSIAGGVMQASPSEVNALNVETTSGMPGVIDIADALRLALQLDSARS